ncbi:hypothetical protein QWY85_03985 [Neolewinella lacunae]|uniref:Outer membrane protein beta-barrel domain-containing protein n=1 Tax=Neolewinella lacunae TaxID=1517758 RepID=A0A923PSB1_9BACT|nr:hypothetical protein [Neolewinella lacunae]MBC6996826.1 hypothetical protein [Neolewinella lacunae]MDN3633804.1 hypothetical protein [Neolewinella lacunae]
MTSRNQDFDALVRQQLKQLPDLPPSGPGWQRLAGELDADDYLRRALTGPALASNEATGWASLERKLDVFAASDSQLAAGLDGLRPAVAPGSWDLLAARLDEADEVKIDALLADRLARNTATGSRGWAALAARLELIGQRRELVAAWKITEFSLLLSLLLLFLRFGGLPDGAGQPVPALAAAQDIASVAPAVGLLPTLAAAPVPERPQALTGNSPELPKLKPGPGLPDATVPTAVRPEASSAPLFPDANEQTTARDVPAPAAEPLLADVSPLATLEYGAQRSLMLPSPALRLPAQPRATPIRYYLNVFFSPVDFNQVVTPATQFGDFDVDSDSRLARGTTAGLLLDATSGKNGLQIGVIYSRRAYIPTALKWYLQEDYPLIEPVKGYSRFIHHSIIFPFNYQRTLRESTDWRLTAQVGMSMSVIANSTFYIPEGGQDLVEAFNSTTGRFDVDPPEADGKRSPSYQSSRKLTDPEPGWLEGGSMLTNASFYLGGGITIERTLSPRWSIYAAPTFGRVIYLDAERGIGPYNDRIHTTNVRLGSRYLFGHK